MSDATTIGFAERIRFAGKSTVTSLSARSGVSRMTQHRIDSGESHASIATLRELAIAVGLDVKIDLVPLSDPDAASAARSLLSDLLPFRTESKAVRDWAARLRRFVGPELNPIDIITEAGIAVAPLDREGGILLVGDWDTLKLVGAAAASGGSWAISGVPALAQLTDDGSATTERGPAIIYAAEPAAVARYLSHMRTARPITATVAILPMNDAVLMDRTDIDGIQFVAPIQAIIDGIGLGGDARDIALAIARSW